MRQSVSIVRVFAPYRGNPNSFHIHLGCNYMKLTTSFRSDASVCIKLLVAISHVFNTNGCCSLIPGANLRPIRRSKLPGSPAIEAQLVSAVRMAFPFKIHPSTTLRVRSQDCKKPNNNIGQFPDDIALSPVLKCIKTIRI